MLESYQRAAFVDGVRLASNENPLGTSPKALAAVRRIADLSRYVDDSYVDIRERLAERHGVLRENVVLGHGSNEIVKLVVQTFVRAGEEAVMAVPSFALFRLAVLEHGGSPIEVPLREGVSDLDAMLAALTPRTRLVLLCDPNNPTGTAVQRADFHAFVERLPPEIVLVVDQAYREYAATDCADATDEVRRRPKTVVLRTMSKIYGLAALRFGYAFADEETVATLERVRLPFNVAATALAGAAAALDDDAFLRRSIACNEAGKSLIYPALAALGLNAYPTQANFYALAVPIAATRAYEDLLGEGIVVRNGDSLRMPGRLRITIGAENENRALLAALSRLLPRWRA